MNNVIDFSSKRDEYPYRTLQGLAMLELFRRDRGEISDPGPEFKRWIDTILPTFGYKLPIDPLEVFDREQLADLMDAVARLVRAFSFSISPSIASRIAPTPRLFVM